VNSNVQVLGEVGEIGVGLRYLKKVHKSKDTSEKMPAKKYKLGVGERGKVLYISVSITIHSYWRSDKFKPKG